MEDGGFTDPYTNHKWLMFLPWCATRAALLYSRQVNIACQAVRVLGGCAFRPSGRCDAGSLWLSLAHRSSLALYVAGAFTSDIGEAVIDEWTLDPQRITFKHVEASTDQVKLVSALSRLGGSGVNTEIEAAPLGIALWAREHCRWPSRLD